jgi:phage replication O-like protein O
MASPQKEDGYTPIANEILDALCQTDIVIAYYEMKCLHFILRKTYGWQKKEDRISLSQFVEGTNIKRPHVCRALKRLLAGNFITQSGNHKSVTYSFQKNYKEWKSLPNRVIVTQRGNAVVPNGVIQVVPNGGHTKETIQKKLLQKKEVFNRPTPEECKLYFTELGQPLIEADIFFDHFNSNGWKVGGKAPMKDWKAAIRNWCRRNKPKTTSLTKPQQATMNSLETLNANRNIKQSIRPISGLIPRDNF